MIKGSDSNPRFRALMCEVHLNEIHPKCISAFIVRHVRYLSSSKNQRQDSFVEGVQVVETFNLGGLNGEG